MEFKKEAEIAKKVALKVGNFLSKQVYKKIEHQRGKDIKLQLDKKSEKIILNFIKRYSNFRILSEESGLSNRLIKNEPYWIVDPLDGTFNYSRDNPNCCLSIALWLNNEPVFGVIYDFNRKELFYRYVGKDLYINEKKVENFRRRKKFQSILATGFPIGMSNKKIDLENFINQIRRYKKIRIIGSAALSLAYVACGRFDVYIEKNVKLWDVAAGLALIKSNYYKSYIKHLANFEVNVKVIPVKR